MAWKPVSLRRPGMIPLLFTAILHPLLKHSQFSDLLQGTVLKFRLQGAKNRQRFIQPAFFFRVTEKHLTITGLQPLLIDIVHLTNVTDKHIFRLNTLVF